MGRGRQPILTLIRLGNLPATSVALNPHGRPRFLVSIDDIKAFDLRRKVKSPKPVVRRRLGNSTVLQFFVDGVPDKSLKW